MRYLAILGIFLLAGCVNQQEQQQKRMAANMEPFMGQSIASYVAVKGPPQTVIDIGPNKKMFQWLIVSQSNAVVVPINGIVVSRPSQTLECRITMSASATVQNPTLADWIIFNTAWAGSC